MRLSELHTGQKCVISKVLGHGAFRKRMIEMGFTRGREVTVLMAAPLKDPVKYEIMGYEVSLRRTEAELVEVVTPDADPRPRQSTHTNTVDDPSCDDPSLHRHAHDRQERLINVALIGNPNCGKTSLFNIASGATEHVGNYSGVTVDAKSGTFEYGGYRFNIVDLPGTYSLTSYSPEERYVRSYLQKEAPDVIVNVVDGSNLERNLYLTTELIDMDRAMVIALNMYDEMQREGLDLDYRQLGAMIGVPIVPTSAYSGKGIDELFRTVINVYEGKDPTVRHIHVSLGNEIEQKLGSVKDALKAAPDVERHFSPRYLAIKLLEHDAEVEAMVKRMKRGGEILEIRDRELENFNRHHERDITAAIADEKYGFIAGALAEMMHREDVPAHNTTHIIDSVVTNRVIGFPIFLAIMCLIFWATFQLGSYPMDWMESAVTWTGDIVRSLMPDGWLKDLVADGIIGGVGGVIVFLPNILILYLCISFMEDSGYMARAAFIMDKVMHKLGLHGKSFIPLVMGFGCTVPAIMASRSIESHSSRMITILINPFISCSARLPIYVLLIGTFFPNHATLVFTSIYFLGILVAGITARLLRKFHFGEDVTPFVMELPPYRIPTLKATLRHMWGKAEQYLRKMGGIILIASIIVWALDYFPLHDEDSTAINAEGLPVMTADDTEIDLAGDSYLRMVGKAVNPIMEPLGFSWRATVAAIAGVPAKEIVVSTLGVLYTGQEDVAESTLSERLTAPNPVTGRPDFTPAVALAFLVFVLLYCPCIATVTAIVKETGNPRYGLFTVVYNTAVAWVAAFITFRLATLLIG